MVLHLVECPYCGKQDTYAVGDGKIIRLFDTRLKNSAYKKALKGNYHTWTCKVCGNKFIISNILCDCKDQGAVVKSKKARPKFICSKCKEEE